MRQYVISYDYGDGVNFTVSNVGRLIREIESAHYSGDAEDGDERYYTLVDGELTEVTFKCTAHGGPDTDDYLYYTYQVAPLAAPDKVVDTFTVTVDGRV